ncbi:MAG: PQQ-binding-like beta-propeller repeat protein, partial [Candidatus Lightella neohaematopini]|nr:PQQ-binding-like beta-propeller repeat protein [Candidatus Lightella neohaematopini]
INKLFYAFILIISILIFNSCMISNRYNRSYLTNNHNYLIKWKIIFHHKKNFLDIINNNKYIVIVKNNGIIQVIDINYGKEIWKKNFFYFMHHKSFNNLKLTKVYLINNNIYLLTNQAEIYAININHGILIWHTVVVMPIISYLLPANHLLIVCSNNILQAINENNGATKWVTSFYNQTILSNNVTITPITFFGIIVIFSNNGAIIAISLDQGNIIWKRYTTITKNRIVNIFYNQIKPIIINNIIYSVDTNNNLIALNLYSGKILWFIKIYIVSNLLYYNNYIYCIDNQCNLISVNIFTGNIIWLQNKIYLNNVITFLMYEHFLLISNYHGNIYVFNILKSSMIYCAQIKNLNINKIFLIKKNNFLILSNNQIINIVINFKY